jgi:shikimate kinase
MLKTVYVLIGPKGSGKTYIGSVLEKEIGLKFLSVEKLGLENIPKSKLSGEELIREGFHQEEAAIDKILQSCNAVSFESTGAHPYLQNILANLRTKYEVKLIKIDTPLEKCYERIKRRNASLHIPVSDESLKCINEAAIKASFDWDLEIDNSEKLTINEIVSLFKNITQSN